MTQNELKILLTRWGQWSASGGQGNTGFKSIWSALIPHAGGNGSSPEVDSEMLMIDTAMGWLKDKIPFDYRLLKLKYRYGYTFNSIADKLTKELPQYRKSKKKMHNNTAQNFVDLAEKTLLEYLKKFVEN